MATTTKQRTAARKNIKKAAAAAKKKQTLKHLPKKTRTALGKQAAKVRTRNAASLSWKACWVLSRVDSAEGQDGNLSQRLPGFRR